MQDTTAINSLQVYVRAIDSFVKSRSGSKNSHFHFLVPNGSIKRLVFLQALRLVSVGLILRLNPKRATYLVVE